MKSVTHLALKCIILYLFQVSSIILAIFRARKNLGQNWYHLPTYPEIESSKGNTEYNKILFHKQDSEMQSLNYEPTSSVSNAQNILKFLCSLSWNLDSDSNNLQKSYWFVWQKKIPRMSWKTVKLDIASL